MKTNKMEATSNTKKSEVIDEDVSSPAGAALGETSVFLTHDQLLAALYWVWDFMDRALINFYLVGNTADAVRDKKPLYGDRVQVAVRKNEWESGARRIADAFASPKEDHGRSLEYEYNGVNVIVHVLDESPTLSSYDITRYEHEYFKLPNSYEQFEKEFPWLK